MKKISYTGLSLIISLFISMMVCGAIAADTPAASPNAPPDVSPNGPPNGGMEHMVQNLTEQGYDVSAIQAAIDSGDNDSARTLLDAFYAEHPEMKPQRPAMDADQLKNIVQELTTNGKDVSEIQAALDSGNTTLAQTLLDEFWKNNPEERPVPPNQGEQPPKPPE